MFPRLPDCPPPPYAPGVSKITLSKLARMSQREFLAISTKLIAHEEAIRTLHAGLDHGVRTLADGLALALSKLGGLQRRGRRARRRGRTSGR